MIIDARHRFTEKQIMDAFHVSRKQHPAVTSYMEALDAIIKDLKELEEKHHEPTR